MSTAQRFADSRQRKTCKVKGCDNEFKTDDRLMDKCQECYKQQIERERQLEADLR